MSCGAEVCLDEWRQYFELPECDFIDKSSAPLAKQYNIAFAKSESKGYFICFSHRCGLTNEDLNRKWSSPDPKLHPEIFHARGILEYMTHILKTSPYMFCDFHGHSNRKNCFFYGCSAKKSWLKMDSAKFENETDFMVLPILMQNCCPSFSLSLCEYKVERNREATARITVWRCYGVKRSYTFETSYCGCDEGLYKGYHFGIKQLKEIGTNFCMSLSSLEEETRKRASLPANNRLSSITSSSSSKSMDFVDEEQSDSD